MAYECKLIECYPGFGPELTTDGNMENDPTTNWPGTGANVAEETTSIHGGCMALEVTATAAPGSARQSITVEAGERYRIGVWGLCNAGTDQWRVTIYLDSTAGLAVRWTSAWHNNAVSWEEEVKFYRVPDGITTIEVRLEVDQIGDVVFFDDVSVRRESPVPMTEIDLQYNVGAGYSLLDRGIIVGRPERVSLYGGRLQLELVRQDDGKRTIPLKLVLEGSDGEDLIDRINALEELLQHATRYREEGWGGEVFLEFKSDDATYTNWFPVYEGEIDNDEYYRKCGGEPSDMIQPLPIWVTCEPYWEADVTYDLSNLLDNPGFEEWNGTPAICNAEPDCWEDYSDAGAAGRNDQETDTVEEGCEALRIETINAGANLYQGVTQDIVTRLRADTEYIVLAWVQNAAITNGDVEVYAEGQNSGIMCYAVNSGAANANYTLVECQFTPNATDIANWVEIRALIRADPGGACTGIAHIDKMLVMEASNVPTGWKASDYLENHYDRDANEVNFMSVCDIPGEIPAETEIAITVEEIHQDMHVAKRTRDGPCGFQWQLIPCEGYTTAEGGAGGACTPGLTDAACIDSDKIIDATSPSGSHIAVSFAGNANMVLRCYWNVTADLIRYYGKFALAVLCKATGATDTINMRVSLHESFAAFQQGYIIEQAVPIVATNDWHLLSGWTVFSFPVGPHDDDLWGTGEFWRIEVYAEHVSANGITDTLEIAGAYLIPLDEAYLISGGIAHWSAGAILAIKNLDGDRGAFVYSPTSDRYYPSTGAVGAYPMLEPEIENWLYFIASDLNEVTITDSLVARVRYRPRGIFLRGANP